MPVEIFVTPFIELPEPRRGAPLEATSGPQLQP
jgi:hypothetical protein